MPAIVILGAGPVGLGAAYRLQQIGYPDWALYEAADVVGGLSRSVVDEAGFTWDLGGHVIFTKHEFFQDLMAVALSGNQTEIERSARIFTHDRWIPYPYQNNVHRLPKDVAVDCIVGAMRAQCAQGREERPANFAEWSAATFGEGITRQLGRPFNEKVWCVPLEEMAYDWIGERVSVVDAERLIANAIHDRDDTGWGPNNRFVFPKDGGTGAIWEGLAGYVGREKIQTGKRAVAVDAQGKRVTFADGTAVDYEWLISAAPLDELVAMTHGAPRELVEASRRLVFNSVEIVGLGLEKPLTDRQTCWMYFIDQEMPCYRVTNFAHYAAANVPGGDVGRYSSYLCEVPHGLHRPLPPGDLVASVVDGLVRSGVMQEADRAKVVSTWRLSLPKGYPIPTLGRDGALSVIQPWLEKNGILSRGRFGTWRYEIGNMDHAAQMGKEAVDRVVMGEGEKLVG